jgi:hypothetical protein
LKTLGILNLFGGTYLSKGGNCQIVGNNILIDKAIYSFSGDRVSTLSTNADSFKPEIWYGKYIVYKNDNYNNTTYQVWDSNGHEITLK